MWRTEWVVVTGVQTGALPIFGGKVTQRLVDVGQSVRRGQILMRIDPVDLTLATAAQERAVAAAEARAVQTAADERRYRDLVSAGAVSASAYHQAKAAALRSAERRVGKECVRTCRAWWSPCHS